MFSLQNRDKFLGDDKLKTLIFYFAVSTGIKHYTPIDMYNYYTYIEAK